MPSTLKQIPPIPAPAENLVDPRTGFMTTSWYLYFKRLDDHVREIEARLDANDAGMSALEARVTDLETP